MSSSVAPASDSISPQAVDTLRKLLEDLKEKPPGSDAAKNLAQIAAARDEVLPRFGPLFSPPSVASLSRTTILDFLRFENNRHWSGLDRRGNEITTDMDRLRRALAILVDESRPLRERLERLRPAEGRKMVPYLGPAVITAILHVVYPDRYGVLNETLRRAMRKLGIWPPGLVTDTLAEEYEAVNPILLELASRLEVDLWTLDELWWHLSPSQNAMSRGSRPADPYRQFAGASDGDSRPSQARHAEHAGSSSFRLPSGLSFSVAEAQSRLRRFCQEEFDYYDAFVDQAPFRIDPIDVIVTKSMNSRVNEADRIRFVHRALVKRCNPLLPAIPVDADLMTYDPQLTNLRRLIHAAAQTPGVKIAVATKVLHRKRRNYIPMIDSHFIKYYGRMLNQPDWYEMSQSPATAAEVAVGVATAFREDLRHALSFIQDLRRNLATTGFDLSPVRILDVLIWTQIEPNGYYRYG